MIGRLNPWKNAVIAMGLILLGGGPLMGQPIDSHRLKAHIDSAVVAIQELPYDTLKLRAMNRLHNRLSKLDRHRQALQLAEDALAMADSLKDTMGLAYAHSQVAYSHYFLGNYPEALLWNKRSIDLANSCLGLYHRSVSYGNTGLLFQEIGQYDSALVYLLECLELREELNDTIHLAYTYYDLGELFLEMGDADRAVTYHKQALELRNEIKDVVDEYNVIEDSYCALAMANHRDGSSDEAMQLLQLALEINREKEDIRRMSNTMRFMGDIYFDQGDYESTIVQYEQSMALDARVRERGNLPSDHLKLGLAWKGIGRSQKALEQLNHALAFAQSLQTMPVMHEAHLHLATIKEELGQVANALQHQKAAYALKEALLDEQKLQAIEEMEVRYETQRQNSLIKELRAQQELARATASLKEAEAEKSRALLWASSVVLLLMSGITFLIVRSNNESRRANQLLAEQKQHIEEKNRLISESLVQKEALLKEIHHRVKNNLQVIASLLSLQSRELSDENAQNAIRQSQNRVNSIALIHQRLYQTEDMAVVDFKDYVTQLISFLKSTFLPEGSVVHAEVEGGGVSLDIDTAVPIGLILNEMVTNSLKYAFEPGQEGQLSVALRKSEDRYTLTYRDNGKGLPTEMDIDALSSLGMKLVRLLAKQLKGELAFRNDQGLEMEFSFPVGA